MILRLDLIGNDTTTRKCLQDWIPILLDVLNEMYGDGYCCMIVHRRLHAMRSFDQVALLESVSGVSSLHVFDPSEMLDDMPQGLKEDGSSGPSHESVHDCSSVLSSQ